jgi:hypothetical protein
MDCIASFCRLRLPCFCGFTMRRSLGELAVWVPPGLCPFNKSKRTARSLFNQ